MLGLIQSPCKGWALSAFTMDTLLKNQPWDLDAIFIFTITVSFFRHQLWPQMKTVFLLADTKTKKKKKKRVNMNLRKTLIGDCSGRWSLLSDQPYIVSEVAHDCSCRSSPSVEGVGCKFHPCKSKPFQCSQCLLGLPVTTSRLTHL